MLDAIIFLCVVICLSSKTDKTRTNKNLNGNIFKRVLLTIPFYNMPKNLNPD